MEAVVGSTFRVLKNQKKMLRRGQQVELCLKEKE
jgi:hypothetical protein